MYVYGLSVGWDGWDMCQIVIDDYLNCSICNHLWSHVRDTASCYNVVQTLRLFCWIIWFIDLIYLSCSFILEDLQGNLQGSWAVSIKVGMWLQTGWLPRARTCPQNSPRFLSFSFHPERSSYRNVGHSSAMRQWSSSSSSQNMEMMLRSSEQVGREGDRIYCTCLGPSQRLEDVDVELRSGL